MLVKKISASDLSRKFIKSALLVGMLLSTPSERSWSTDASAASAEQRCVGTDMSSRDAGKEKHQPFLKREGERGDGEVLYSPSFFCTHEPPPCCIMF